MFFFKKKLIKNYNRLLLLLLLLQNRILGNNFIYGVDTLARRVVQLRDNDPQEMFVLDNIVTRAPNATILPFPIPDNAEESKII